MKNLLLSSLLLVLTCASFGEEAPTTELEGVLIERPDGTFMQFVIQESLVYCYFFDADMKPIDPDVDRVAVRILRQSPKTENAFSVAIPYEGVKGLRAPKFIKAPRVFQANLSFMRNDIKDPVEFYFFRYPDAVGAAEPVTIFEGDPRESLNR